MQQIVSMDIQAWRTTVIEHSGVCINIRNMFGFDGVGSLIALASSTIFHIFSFCGARKIEVKITSASCSSLAMSSTYRCWRRTLGDGFLSTVMGVVAGVKQSDEFKQNSSIAAALTDQLRWMRSRVLNKTERFHIGSAQK